MKDAFSAPRELEASLGLAVGVGDDVRGIQIDDLVFEDGETLDGGHRAEGLEGGGSVVHVLDDLGGSGCSSVALMIDKPDDPDSIRGGGGGGAGRQRQQDAGVDVAELDTSTNTLVDRSSRGDEIEGGNNEARGRNAVVDGGAIEELLLPRESPAGIVALVGT